MKKIIFPAAGSVVDPGFDRVILDDKPYMDYMKGKGITVIDPIVIESCHGCPEIMMEYSRQAQSMVDRGDRVVGLFNGGLYLAGPSIQATQVTFPIISCPTDMVAYQAFMLPSGHACIAGVGIDSEDPLESTPMNIVLDTTQRKKALVIAERMLNLDEKTVDIAGEKLDSLEKRLSNFGIKIKPGSKLKLYFGDSPQENSHNEYIQVWADSEEDLFSGSYSNEVEQVIYQSKNTLQVKGIKNIAIYAAKILSLQRPELREKILEIGRKKLESYGKARNLMDEVGR